MESTNGVSILRFQELIGSPEYDEHKFQSFINAVVHSNSSLEAYKLVGRHTLENIDNLAVEYKQKGNIDYEALWSGNLAHELIGLVDFRTAGTQQGVKSRNESIKKLTEPGYHPGD